MGKLGEILTHPEEFMPMVRMYYAAQEAAKLPDSPDLSFCYDILNTVSRSFAIVIQQLPVQLRNAICIFYLVLRGLDTVEDDMALDNSIKLPALRSFHEKIYQKGFTLKCGTNHYARLMDEFGRVVNVFLDLDVTFQAVIADITKRMGHGMAEFIEKEVVTLADYDKYCHYVAGLVGIGLSKLFASSGLESREFESMDELSNHMGLYLQKTNIIRDYLEDIMEEPRPRMFWPREIWGKYAGQLDEFADKANRKAAVQCLNHMITDALRHMPYCIDYMVRVRDPSVFRFCAIPQIMAAGTLAMCYNNGKVFEGVVKMRRGQTARVFDECHNMRELYVWFIQFLDMMSRKVHSETARDDPSLPETKETVAAMRNVCVQGLVQWDKEHPRALASAPRLLGYALVFLAAAYTHCVWKLGSTTDYGILQPYMWVFSQYEQYQRPLSVLLLLLAFFMTVTGKR